MDILYGEAQYTQGDIRCHGKIILSSYKLFLRGPEGDLAQTYIPLDKIIKLRRGRSHVVIDVRLSQVNRYRVVLKLEEVYIKDLIETLARRLGLKKRFLINEWACVRP